MCSVCPCAPVCPVCVPCVSRLPPVSFYRCRWNAATSEESAARAWMSLEQLDILRKACADVRKADDGGPGWCEAWAALHFLCPEVAPGAAEILDSKMITRVVARHSRREFFLVEGSQKRDYTCMPGFCTCDYYCQRVATRPDALVCKHELAVLLAGSLGVAHQCELDDGEWATKFELAISVECVVLTRHSPRVLSAPPAPPRSQFADPCSHTDGRGTTLASLGGSFQRNYGKPGD